MKKHTHCELCFRPSSDISKHHLIPRACHSTAWFEKRFTKLEMGQRAVYVCRECHRAIHAAVPKEKDLGRYYNTKELLESHPFMKKHIEWMRRKYKTTAIGGGFDWPINECKHERVPFVKSYHSDEMVQRGPCPDCNTVLLELD